MALRSSSTHGLHPIGVIPPSHRPVPAHALFLGHHTFTPSLHTFTPSYDITPLPPSPLPPKGGNAVLGYLLGGAIIGPYALGLISDVHSIKHLAEIGVVLLLFNIGRREGAERAVASKKGSERTGAPGHRHSLLVSIGGAGGLRV
jgi:hypothetical protein